MQCCTKPSVGIWWFYYDDILFVDPIEVEKGHTYGDCIIGLSDHADFWDKLAAEGKLSELPQPLRSEYFYIPRGRVVFHKDTGRFTILHGVLKKRELNKIRKYFCLKRELTDFDTDFHYKLKPWLKLRLLNT
ncbi:hypothetical protein SAMN04487775_10781 [Treponema bryantii]|uniref:Uncharacterized protein n=1 Tax=Treponema bryantii TaxID=163 RepID=A0A1I3LMG0_9SPIR|nr:hypothetical protein [Treponema bryantii]SFI85944.1 hypothetical protein SAMN04487775_10781 [Treponema bryantii]